VRVWSEDGLTGGQRARIEAAVSTTVEAERARRMALDPGNVARLLEPVPFRNLELESEDGGGRSVTGMIMGLGASFFLYMLILLYGTQVMRSAQEEKANRVSEILVSSMRAGNLMLGKVLGVGASALLQVSIWGLFVVALLLNPGPLARIGIPPEAVAAVLSAVDFSNLLMLAVFVLLGFFLYATLFAALGATAETMETAQRFSFPLTLPLFVPIILGESIRTNPSETLAVVLSWVPLTAPLVMPTRILFGGVGWPEASANVVWLFFCVIAFGWLAGKIYRAGILNTGKSATWADVLRWVKAT
jgi:ABC-2 type transport system permease protein